MSLSRAHLHTQSNGPPDQRQNIIAHRRNVFNLHMQIYHFCKKQPCNMLFAESMAQQSGCCNSKKQTNFKSAGVPVRQRYWRH